MTSTSGSNVASEVPPWELVLYPLHLIPRVAAKLLVFTAAVVGICGAAVGFTLLISWALSNTNLDISKFTNLINRDHLPLLGLVTALSLIGSALLKIAGESALKTLRGIAREVRKAMKGRWLPRPNLRQSLVETWTCSLRQVIPTAVKLCLAGLKLMLASLLLVLPSLVIYAKLIDQRDQHSQSVSQPVQRAGERADEEPRIYASQMEAMHAAPARVVAVGGRGTNNVATLAVPAYVGHVHEIPHVEQGDLSGDTTGICLDAHVSLPWLRAFKDALEECAEATPGCRPAVTVRGFASKAPVGDPERSEGAPSLSQANLNCEIANRRAEEVVSFLVLEDDYECQAHEHWPPLFGRRDPCQRDKTSYQFGDAEGLAFDVSYEPWRPPEAMVEAKPADDGKLPGERRYKVEFFNRAVQLTLSNYGCDREQCEAARSEDGDARERGATSSGGDAAGETVRATTTQTGGAEPE